MEEKSGLTRLMDGVSAFNKKLAVFAGWVVVVMMLTITYDVAARYQFNAPTTWSFEINRYMLIMVVFLGGAWTLPAGGHVSVDIFTETLSQERQQKLDLVVSVMAAVYMLVFFWESLIFTYDAWNHGVRSTEYLAWPLWPIRFMLVIGSGSLFLEYLIRIIKNSMVIREQAELRYR
jgi:TRAP-type C4-dicarboxylate transport system permease small subunit